MTYLVKEKHIKMLEEELNKLEVDGWDIYDLDFHHNGIDTINIKKSDKESSIG